MTSASQPDGAAIAEDSGSQRLLGGSAGLVLNGLLLAQALIGLGYTAELHLTFEYPILGAQYLAAMLGLALASVFLLVAPGPRARSDRVPWYDILLSVLSLIVGGYVVWEYPTILALPAMTPVNVTLGALAILLLLEATRRMLGWSLVIFSLAGMAVALWGHQVGITNVNYTWQRWVYFFYLDENGIYGNILELLATVVFAFVVFGRTLTFVGGARALIDLTVALVGRFSGGPAKAAVIASGLMGTVTGSIAVNAVTTGTITIPLMKNHGYRPSYAAGVECASSAGGPLMPPVMGIIAFLIAQFLGIPYYEVALAAALPAILYYVTILLIVHLDASAAGLAGLKAEELPAKGPALRGALPFVVPLGVIIYSLFVLQLAPERAALYGAAVSLLLGLASADVRRRLIRLHLLLIDIARNFLMLAVIGGVAGLIVSSLVLSGIGLSFVASIRDLAGDSLFLILLLSAIANIILGLGLPATVTYIVLAVLVAPTIAQFGVPPLAAHLFTLYFAVAAELTPPAGTAVFVSMGIARSPFLETAIHAMKLAVGIFLIPFVFVYRPELLVVGSPLQVAATFALVATGFSAVAFGASALVQGKLGYLGRIGLVIGGVAMLIPGTELNIAGGALIAALWCWLLWRQRTASSVRI
jgi:TRAP transporter 4TM/12TM fusion protein